MHPNQNNFCVVAAAGRGSRFSADGPKQYADVLGAPLLAHTVSGILSCEVFEKIVVVLPAGDNPPGWLLQRENIVVVSGGATRQHSVWSGLKAVSQWAGANDWVWVHDGARPVLSEHLVSGIRQAQTSADMWDGVVPALPSVDTLKEVDASGRVVRTLDRNGIWRAQTPQVFRFEILCRAVEACMAQGLDMTDESAAVELTGGRVKTVAGDPRNIKLTIPADRLLIEQYLAEDIRSGRRQHPKQWLEATLG
jgi:2-C-methyl-D-erythritol 4-phosphate cytidylyltransferase